MRDVTGAEAASLVKVITPKTDPGSCGVKEIVTTCVAPVGSTIGKVGLTMLKPVPVTVPANTDILPVPGFDIVIV